MKRRMLAACIAMCTMVMVTFMGTTGKAMNVHAADDETGAVIYAAAVAAAAQEIYTAAKDDTDLCSGTAAGKAAETDYTQALDKTLEYLRKTADDPQFGAEWNVLTLARCGYEDALWYGEYYDNVVEYVRKNKSAKLHERKSTDNSRTILALTAIGADVTDVGGYNLLEPLADMKYVTEQGINGPVYALIAFDTAGYDIPTLPKESDGVQTTREGLIKYILGRELAGGGWAFNGDSADPDMTCMTIQGLAPYYKSDAEVRAAVDRALDVMSELQKEDGGFASWGTVNSESCAQVICALLDLGRDAGEDQAFVKNGHSVLNALMDFYIPGEGGFAHAEDKNGELFVNGMASQQAGYALVAYDRFKNDRNTLYDMSDAKPLYIRSVAKAEVTLDSSSFVYDGKAKKPDVTVKLGGRTLKAGVDYTVTYQNNVNAGSAAKVVINGKGIYNGTASRMFVIKPKTLPKTSVSLENGAAGITFRWKRAAGADEYVVLKKAGSAKSWTTVTTTKALSYTDKKVKNGTKYIYAVKPVGNKVAAAYTAVTTYRLSQETITDIRSTARSKCTVTYVRNTGAAGYKIMYSTDKAFKKSVRIYKVTDSRKAKAVLSGLAAGKRYYVRVQAYKTVGKTSYYGAWSKTANVVIRKK